MTNATVIALDVNEEKLQLAKDVGAHHVFVSNDDAISEVKNLTHGLVPRPFSTSSESNPQ